MSVPVGLWSIRKLIVVISIYAQQPTQSASLVHLAQHPACGHVKLSVGLDFDACSFSRTNFQDVVDSCLLKEHNAAAFRTALIRLPHPRSHTEPSRETESPPPPRA